MLPYSNPTPHRVCVGLPCALMPHALLLLLHALHLAHTLLLELRLHHLHCRSRKRALHAKAQQATSIVLATIVRSSWLVQNSAYAQYITYAYNQEYEATLR